MPAARSSAKALKAAFFTPPKSALGERLRAPFPRAVRSKRKATNQATESVSSLDSKSLHAARVLPPAALSRILDGSIPGSASQISEEERVSAAAGAIAKSGGAAGDSLQPKLATLAKLADFAAVGGFAGDPSKGFDIFEHSVGGAFAASYLSLIHI